MNTLLNVLKSLCQYHLESVLEILQVQGVKFMSKTTDMVIATFENQQDLSPVLP